jgi:hypothetical protein
MRIRVLQLAWRALRPAQDTMKRVCCYKLQRPETGSPDEIYCRNPRRPLSIKNPTECDNCKHRVLPYDGYKYFDLIHLDGICSSVLQRLLSIATGVLAIWIVFKTAIQK